MAILHAHVPSFVSASRCMALLSVICLALSQHHTALLLGGQQSLDWTSGLDWWTGLSDVMSGVSVDVLTPPNLASRCSRSTLSRLYTHAYTDVQRTSEPQQCPGRRIHGFDCRKVTPAFVVAIMGRGSRPICRVGPKTPQNKMAATVG